MLDFERARRTMVDCQIRTGDVTDQHVLQAFYAVPREIFVPEAQRSIAYRDRGIALGDARYMLDPMTLGKLLQLADIRPGETVLDIGCGTGYAAALMARMGAKITALESEARLADYARAAIPAGSDVSVDIVTGPLTEGVKAKGPFDVIFVEGRIDSVPPAIEAQLKAGGRLVAIVGRGSLAGQATVFTRLNDDLSGWPAFDAAAPLLPGFEKPHGFVF